MIIELRPKLFTKRWLAWLSLRIRQDVFDELEKEKQEARKKIIDAWENWR